MQVMTYPESVFNNVYASFGFVHDWYDLAVLLNVDVKNLAYIKKQNRTVMPGEPGATQIPIKIKDRITYDSCKSLKYIQNRLMLLLNQLYEEVPYGYVLAYRKGFNAIEYISKMMVGHEYTCHFDIRKYYDNIRFWHIRNVLQYYGFTEPGASLITQYCTVRRKTKDNHIITSLQQGSPVSPVLSNLVGYLYIDQPVLRWLKETMESKYPGIKYQYTRYCDNIFVALDGSSREQKQQLFIEYKKAVQAILQQASFQSHSWSLVPQNHPKRNQQFLGVVLNSTARIDKWKYYQMRSILFNACAKGLSAAANMYWERNELPALNDVAVRLLGSAEGIKLDKFVQVMRGKVAYLKSINQKHYCQTTKLLHAATWLHSSALALPGVIYHEETGLLAPELFQHVKTYLDNTESVKAFDLKLNQLLQSKEEGEAASENVANYS